MVVSLLREVTAGGTALDSVASYDLSFTISFTKVRESIEYIRPLIRAPSHSPIITTLDNRDRDRSGAEGAKVLQ